MTKTIEIIVTPAGKTSIQTLGFTGPACREASKFLEEALGTRQSAQRTAEFHQTAESSEIQRLQKGLS